LVINALIERKGAKTALVTTSGFRDVLEIGTERRYDLYDLQQTYPEPLVPRQRRFGISERVWHDGRVIERLDDNGLVQIVESLKGQDVEAVAVCLLHSYINPVHERRVGESVAALAPGIAVSLSSEVLPEIREYERTATTVVNAYVRPMMRAYLGRLGDRLRTVGFRGQLLIMLSSGGVTGVETASAFPVRIVESGPVAGVIMAQHVADLAH